MLSLSLDAYLSSHAFALMLLIARIGGVIMLFPGIGEPYVPPRTRMIFTLMLCLLLLEPMISRLPAMPASAAETARLVLIEVIIGVFFGTVIRMINSALEATGMIVGLGTGLSNATMLNPAQASQSVLPGAFLSTAGLALIFITGLDHFLLRSTVALYNIFPAGAPLLSGDMAQTVIRLANQCFVVGISMAAPFIIMALLLDTLLGLMQRLMPQVQIYMMSMPVQIVGGLILFILTLSGILTFWLKFFDQTIATFFQP